jgi:hypothetical protein
MAFVAKDTMNGDDIRTYHCKHCNADHDLYFGTAMWKLWADRDKPDSN